MLFRLEGAVDEVGGHDHAVGDGQPGRRSGQVDLVAFQTEKVIEQEAGKRRGCYNYILTDKFHNLIFTNLLPIIVHLGYWRNP